MSQAAESLTVRGTAAGSRPFATDATSAYTASEDVPLTLYILFVLSGT